MCLYIDDYDDWTPLGRGERTARKAHRCIECGRTIEPGERYLWWSGAADGRAETMKMCGHCQGVIDLGHAITGCPKGWNVTMLYDRDPDIGFVANCLEDDGHDLSPAERDALTACFDGAAARWRDDEGELVPVPQPSYSTEETP